MAIAFEAQQRLSQDAAGKTLTLIDFSNYNDVPVDPDDPYVNSQGNDDGVSILDFVSRKWILVDINGNIEEAVFPYDLVDVNKCSILIDRDKYLSITLIVSTLTEDYSSVIQTGLHRQAEYKLYILSGKDKCCNEKTSQAKIDAKNFIDSAIFKLRHYDEQGFESDILAANKLLNSFV